MAKKAARPAELWWAENLETHVSAHGLSWSTVASAMNLTEGAIRHWRNGTRVIKLIEFVRLCEAAKADVSTILLGRPALTQGQLSALQNAFKPTIDTPALKAPPKVRRPARATSDV